MTISRTYVLRALLLTFGVAVLALCVLMFIRQRIVEGFLLAFVGLSTISLHQTDVDYETRHDAKSFMQRLRTGRSSISTLGWVCDISSYLCLAAALISWLALR